MEIREIKQKDWEAEGERLFGPKMRNWKFVCPCCGTVQDGNDFLKAGVNEETAQGMLGFSCIGRVLPKCRGAFEKGPGPCDYAGGGLIRLNPIKIIRDTGKPVYYFDFYRGKNMEKKLFFCENCCNESWHIYDVLNNVWWCELCHNSFAGDDE